MRNANNAVIKVVRACCSSDIKYLPWEQIYISTTKTGRSASWAVPFPYACATSWFSFCFARAAGTSTLSAVRPCLHPFPMRLRTKPFNFVSPPIKKRQFQLWHLTSDWWTCSIIYHNPVRPETAKPPIFFCQLVQKLLAIFGLTN